MAGDDDDAVATVRRSISFVFLVLFPLFEAACYAHLGWKRNDLLLRKRGIASICIVSIAGWIAYFNLVVSLFGGVPCGVFYVATLLVPPICVGPQIVRALTLRGNIKYSQLVTEEEISSRAQRRKTGKLPTIPSVSGSGELSSERLSNAGEASSPALMTKMMEANLIMEWTRKVVRMVKWALLVVPTLLLILLLALTSDEDQLLATDFDQCQPEPTLFAYASPAFAVVSTALALLVTILVKKIEDEIGLRREIQRNALLLGLTYIAIIGVRFAGHYEWQPLLQTMQQMLLSFSMSIAIFLPDSPLTRAATWAKRRINPATRSAVPGYAQSLPRRASTAVVQTTASKRTSVQLFGRKGSTEVRQDREVSVSWDAGLAILLSTEEGLTLFSQHCAREFSSENVRFWCDVNDYKAKFDVETGVPPTSSEPDDIDESSPDVQPTDSVEIAAVAKGIFSIYFDPKSKAPVNLSSKQKADVKMSIDTGKLTRDTFDAAQREIFGVMSRDSYPRFVRSKKNRALMT